MKNETNGKSMNQILVEGLDNAFSTERYQRFLAFVAGNPNYSYRNVILILQQCPSATKTKGIRAWNKEDRLVKAGERGLRINVCFDRDRDKNEDEPPSLPSKRKQGQRDTRFRKVSVYDISQTRAMDGEDAQEPQSVASVGSMLELVPPQGYVSGYDVLLGDLRVASTLPIIFSDNIEESGSTMLFDIVIKEGMGQLNTIRAVIFQIALLLLRDGCPDQELIQVAARSVTFIVSRHLSLDTSGFGFYEVTQHSANCEQSVMEEFLDAIQKTALYFIDTIVGIREARALGYATEEYFLFTNKKTAMRMFRQGHFVYLVYPGEGELLAMNKKALEKYDGPFAVPREGWFGLSRLAA